MHEGVRIASDGYLNSKSEWRQNQVKRLAVHLTERELRQMEKELVAGEAKLNKAMVVLSNKLKEKCCLPTLSPLINLDYLDLLPFSVSTYISSIAKRKDIERCDNLQGIDKYNYPDVKRRKTLVGYPSVIRYLEHSMSSKVIGESGKTDSVFKDGSPLRGKEDKILS